MDRPQAFTVGISDSNPLSRRGIRATLNVDHADMKATVAWEAGSLNETIRELQNFPSLILIVSFKEFESELMTYQ